MATQTQLQYRVNLQNARLDKASAALDSELRKVTTRYVQISKGIVANDIPSDVNIPGVIALLPQFRQALIDAGRPDILESVRREYVGLAQESAKFLEVQGIDTPFAGLSKETLDAFVALEQEQILLTMDRRLVRPMHQSIIQSSLALRSRDEVVREVTSQIDAGNIVRKDGKDFTDHQVIALVSDSFDRFTRTTVALQAEANDMDVFVYMGPLDRITSDQCKALLLYNKRGAAGYYYKDDISVNIHPALKYDPFIAGGHPLCRHRFYPVTLDYAKSQGFIA